MTLIPRLLERNRNLIDMQIPFSAAVTKYRFRASNTLNGAFTAPVTMFEVDTKRTYASPTLHKRNLEHFQGAITNLTRVRFDINDFSLPSNTIPLDDFQFYLVIEEFRGGAYVTNSSPVITIPTTEHYHLRYTPISLYGTAPIVGTAAPGLPAPPGSLVISTGGVTDSLLIKNNNTAPGDRLLFSIGENSPLIVLAAGESINLREVGAKIISLVTDAGTAVPFDIISSVNID